MAYNHNRWNVDGSLVICQLGTRGGELTKKHRQTKLHFKNFFPVGSCLTATDLSRSSGTIKSPGWPYQYSNNVAKCWRIYAPYTNYVVKLTITALSLEFCSSCRCDSIEFFDGSSKYSRGLGKFCTGNVRVTSSGRYLYMKFTSDSSVTRYAFTATYTAVRKGKC